MNFKDRWVGWSLFHPHLNNHAGWWFGTFFAHRLGISSSQLIFIFFRGQRPGIHCHIFFHPPLDQVFIAPSGGRCLQPDIRSYGVALRACQRSQQWRQALLLLWRAKNTTLQLMLGRCSIWLECVDEVRCDLDLYKGPSVYQSGYPIFGLDILVPSCTIFRVFGGSR